MRSEKGKESPKKLTRMPICSPMITRRPAGVPSKIMLFNEGTPTHIEVFQVYRVSSKNWFARIQKGKESLKKLTRMPICFSMIKRRPAGASSEIMLFNESTLTRNVLQVYRVSSKN